MTNDTKVTLKGERVQIVNAPWWRIAAYIGLNENAVAEVSELLDFHGNATVQSGGMEFRIEVSE